MADRGPRFGCVTEIAQNNPLTLLEMTECLSRLSVFVFT